MADRGRGGQRQAKLWTVINATRLNLTASATVVGNGTAVNNPATLLRMLGEYEIGATGGATIVETDFCVVVVAIGVFSTDAFDLGATAMPDPANEPEYPWLYWASHPMSFPSGGDNGTTAGASVRKMFDIRSMRRLKPRETFGFVVQYVDVAGAPDLSLGIGATRVLNGIH